MTPPSLVPAKFADHIFGVWLLTLTMTFPDGVSTTKFFGNFPIRVSDVLLLVLFFYLLAKNFKVVNFTWLLLGLTFTCFYIRGLYAEINPALIRRDIEGLFYLFMGISLAKFFHHSRAFSTIAKYLLVSLWFSFIVLSLGQLGLPLTQRYGSRVSFNYSSEINLDRVVTPTLFLAWIAICYCLLEFASRRISIKAFLAIFLPSISIGLVSGTRLTLLFVFLPVAAIVFFLSIDFKGNRIKILMFICSLGFMLTLIAPSDSNWQVNRYINNLLERSSIVASEQDGSYLYRSQELSRGLEALKSKPILGYGPGVNFLDSGSDESTDSGTISPTDWIRSNRGSYVHSTQLHLGLKFGFPFLLFIFLVLCKRLIIFRGFIVKEPAIGVSLVGLLIASFFWNIFNDLGGVACAVLLFGFLGHQPATLIRNKKESRDQEIDLMGG